MIMSLERIPKAMFATATAGVSAESHVLCEAVRRDGVISCFSLALDRRKRIEQIGEVV